MAGPVLRYPSDAHAACDSTTLAPGGTLDFPAGRLPGPPGRWGTRGDGVVERVSTSRGSHYYVLYHAPSRPEAQKIWVKISMWLWGFLHEPSNRCTKQSRG